MKRAGVVIDTVFGVGTLVVSVVIGLGWLLSGSHSLGLDGDWAHAVAMAAFMAYSEASITKAQRTIEQLQAGR